MARVDDKARFYLERAVPQLREFEEKEIFTREEIRTLVQKRTEFEHRILAPGNKPDDFLAYIAWEQSLEQLRAKRCRRLRIRHAATAHAGQARLFQTFERAVSRHPGSATLWRRYLDCAAAAGATKRWRRVVTRALRMRPGDAELWVLAGRRAARDGDMEGARGFFMRGCRFCTRDATVWLEYARAEMDWLARMEKKKGTREFAIAATAAPPEDDGDEEAQGIMRFDDEDDEDDNDDFGGGDLALTDRQHAGGSGKKQQPKAVFSQEAVQKLEKSPALDGAIPRAIYDISRKQGFFKPSTAEAFFDMFSTFTAVAAQPKIIQHVLDSMAEAYPNDPATANCQVRQPLVGVDPDTAGFPKALREALARLKAVTETTADKVALAAKTVAWIDPILSIDDLDAGIRAVLEHTKRGLESP